MNPDITTEAPSAPETATPTTPDGSTPPAVAPATPETPVVDLNDLSGFSLEQLEQAVVLSSGPREAKKGTAPAAPAAPVAPGTPATPATPEGTIVPPVVVAPDDKDDMDEGKPTPKNFRFHTEDPTRAAFLQIMRREPGTNPIEAARRAGYVDPAAPSNPATPPAAPAAPPDPLKSLRDKIEDLKARRVEANAAYESDKVIELSDDLADAKLELRDAERALAEQEASRTAFETDYQSFRAVAVGAFPQGNVAGTPQQKALRKEIAYLQETNPEFFHEPDYPVRLNNLIKAEHPEWFPGATPAAPPVTAPVVPPATPKEPARPVGAVVPGNNPTESLTPALAIDQIGQITDLATLTAIADRVGTKRTK